MLNKILSDCSNPDVLLVTCIDPSLVPCSVEQALVERARNPCLRLFVAGVNVTWCHSIKLLNPVQEVDKYRIVFGKSMRFFVGKEVAESQCLAFLLKIQILDDRENVGCFL